MIEHDYHVHTRFSDGIDDVATMVATAHEYGLRRLGISDHVRSSTVWLPEYVEAVERAKSIGEIEVLCGVEAKILDLDGRLDMPGDLAGLDYVLIADHQLPATSGPIRPAAVAAQLTSDAIDARDVIELLVEATINAAEAAPIRPIIAHLFSLLPKMGLHETQVPTPLLKQFGNRLAAGGAAVEINEKWTCPSRRVAHILHAAGVELVAGSDSHKAGDIGRYRHVRSVGYGLVAGVPSLTAR